jgi:hypothetical protein
MNKNLNILILSRKKKFILSEKIFDKDLDQMRFIRVNFSVKTKEIFGFIRDTIFKNKSNSFRSIIILRKSSSGNIPNNRITG